MGTLASTFISLSGGGLAVTILMVVFQGNRLSELRELPWWVFGAGLMGLVVVASLGVSVANLGLGAGLTLFTTATLILGALIKRRAGSGMGALWTMPLLSAWPSSSGGPGWWSEADFAQPKAMTIATIVRTRPTICRERRCSAFTRRASSTVTAG